MADVTVEWIDSGREPKCAPNPRYPEGIDVDFSDRAEKTCKVELPYPAKRCGFYRVVCQACGLEIVVTTAGRPDDPRSVMMPCKRSFSQSKQRAPS
jgi:hypothetical protein